MRGILGAIALLVVLAVIGLSAKQQLQASRAAPATSAAASAALAGTGVAPPTASPQQLQRDIGEAVTRDIQPRPRGDEER